MSSLPEPSDFSIAGSPAPEDVAGGASSSGS
uniref:Uncharacterized protein n=1 Tax=Arundo donax TaxID=35708 RepID=A0A0A8YX46_ARUDO